MQTLTHKQADGVEVATVVEEPARVKIYLAGPIDSSGREDLNRPTFDRAARELRAKGFCVYNPFDGVRPGEKRADIQRRNFRYLIGCDWIVFLPNYISSPGCAAEAACAIECGLAPFDIHEILQDWYEAPKVQRPTLSAADAGRVHVPLLVGSVCLAAGILLFVFLLVQYGAK